MEVVILYQCSEDGDKDFMGLSLNLSLMQRFEEYLNCVQKYNFYAEVVGVNNYSDHLQTAVAVSQDTYLNEYLISYFKRFLAERCIS